MASDREALIEKALKAIMAEPFGCPACDSGKLRRNDKRHWPECGFALAVEALAAPPSAQDGWQPIETAPKAVGDILLGWPTMVLGGYWSDYRGRQAWVTSRGEYCGSAGPNHWMPLPPPPAGAPK